MSDIVIRVTDLVAGHHGTAAVHGLRLQVAAGEIVALLGANGAGKTTTLLTIAGKLAPIAGSIEVLGTTVGGLPTHRIARLGLSLVPEDRGVFFGLTVTENLRVHTRRGTPAADDEVFDHFPALRPLASRKAGLLSGGEQQMLGLGCALMSRPKVLLIDEMSHGLARIVVETLLPVIRAIAGSRNMAVLLVEQHIGAALAIADRAYVLQRGTTVCDGDIAALRGNPDILTSGYLGGPAAHIVNTLSGQPDASHENGH